MAEFQARDKLAFLLSLVPWLMDHDGATVAEAAEHFGVSAQQIRDAVELIAVSGVPGDTDSYQHGDLFDINWDAFEERDEIVLTNLVAIDDSPALLGARGHRADRRAAVPVVAARERGQRDAREPHREAQPRRVRRAQPGRRRRGRVGCRARRDARADPRLGRRAACSSSSTTSTPRGQRERRRVDPLRVESFDDDWYLRGWCHLREAVRTFRLDRISNAVITDAPIEHRADEVRLPDRLFEASPDDLEVTIEVAPAAMPLLVDYIPDGATSTEVGGRIRTTLRVSHFHGLKRLIASMPGVATVVAPPSARAAVAEWAAAGAARYR